MAKDIFNNTADSYPTITGGIKFKNNAVLAFTAGNGYKGMVIQNYNIDYQQNVTKLRGLNTPNIVTVVAPPNGTMSIVSSIVSSIDYYKFLEDFGDSCKVQNNKLQVANTNAEPCGVDFKAPDVTMTGCLCNRVQLSQTIDNLVLSSTTNIEFVALQKN